LEQLNHGPGIKFGSFNVTSVPVGLQRCGGGPGGGSCA
jgi:hypothetical protein